MRALMLAAALAAAAALPATAQSWTGDPAPVLRSAADPGAHVAGRRAVKRPRSNAWCTVQRVNLHRFQAQVRRDGYVSIDEMRIANALRADVATTCGRSRWAPNRRWAHR